MENNRQQILDIAGRIELGTASKEDMALMEAWYASFESAEGLELVLSEQERRLLREQQLGRLNARLDRELVVVKKRKLWPRIGVAASIALAVLVGGYFYQIDNSKKDGQVAQADIDPGKTAATLTFSDGRKIYIADAISGRIAEESGVKISKNEKGELIYTIVASDNEPAKMQTLTTYLGETQIVVLPDGSKVWLNAASSLKYPSSFASFDSRKVELTGEAYFEVSKDKAHPFVVATAKQDVEVLGTHFNINTYVDEPSVKTTLLEGSVRITTLGGAARVLKPGEQSTLSGENSIKVSEVDVDDVVAWKDGFFAFDDQYLGDVMKQLSRWYKVEVEYSEADLKNNKFSGSISRYAKVSQVLDKLGKTGSVSFRLQDRKIVVANKSKH